jgi:hypothetical protein
LFGILLAQGLTWGLDRHWHLRKKNCENGLTATHAFKGHWLPTIGVDAHLNSKVNAGDRAKTLAMLACFLPAAEHCLYLVLIDGAPNQDWTKGVSEASQNIDALNRQDEYDCAPNQVRSEEKNKAR